MDDVAHDNTVNSDDTQALMAARNSGPDYADPADLDRDGYVNRGPGRFLLLFHLVIFGRCRFTLSTPSPCHLVIFPPLSLLLPSVSCLLTSDLCPLTSDLCLLPPDFRPLTSDS